jgi:hypothetical protein
MQSACAILYCHLWPVWLYHIFPRYLINGTIIGTKKIIEHKTYVLIFCTAVVWNISHFKKNSARYYHKRTEVFMQSTRYSCQILMKLEFYRWIFQQSQISNFMKISPLRAKLFHADGRTDGQTDRQQRDNFVNGPTRRKRLISTLTMGCRGQCLRILPTVTYPHTLQCTIVLGRVHSHAFSFTVFSRVMPLPLPWKLPLSISCNMSIECTNGLPMPSTLYLQSILDKQTQDKS